ncbi:MAG TPA: hypothetical protein VG347_24835 [Verrucomicrobiae bacterium]|nr:hypothetical protein [Verrucomicrobiae bacterium]
MNDSLASSEKPKDGLSFIHSSLDEAGLSHAEFRVYCHVNRRAGRHGVCDSALANIAAHCGYCDEVARCALKHLTGLNMLLMKYIPGVGTEYRLTAPREWKLDARPPLGKNPRGVRKSQGTPPRKSYHYPSEKVVPKGIPFKGSPMKGRISQPPMEDKEGWQLRKDLRESTDPQEISGIKAEIKRRQLVGKPQPQPVHPMKPKTSSKSIDIFKDLNAEQRAAMGKQLRAAVTATAPP